MKNIHIEAICTAMKTGLGRKFAYHYQLSLPKRSIFHYIVSKLSLMPSNIIFNWSGYRQRCVDEIRMSLNISG